MKFLILLENYENVFQLLSENDQARVSGLSIRLIGFLETSSKIVDRVFIISLLILSIVDRGSIISGEKNSKNGFQQTLVAYCKETRTSNKKIRSTIFNKVVQFAFTMVMKFSQVQLKLQLTVAR